MVIPIRLLLVEDSADDAEILLRGLDATGMATVAVRVQTAAEMHDALAGGTWDIVIADYSMPHFNALGALRVLHDNAADLPLIVVSGTITEETAVAAMKAGARDYVMKENLARLAPAIARELREADARREHKGAERALQRASEEFRIARDIQQRFFPINSPPIPGFEVAGSSWPAADTGGDYYDYFPVTDGRWGIAIGDVSGHGIGPSLLMASTRAFLRAISRVQTDVSCILKLANGLLVADSQGYRYVTLFLSLLDPVNQTFTYASAGHPPAVVLDRSGAVRAELWSTSVPLGILDEAEFPASAPVALERGDVLLLLTDGVIEAHRPDGAVFGFDRAIRSARETRGAPARQIVASLYDAVRSFAGSAPQLDDCTAVVVKAID